MPSRLDTVWCRRQGRSIWWKSVCLFSRRHGWLRFGRREWNDINLISPSFCSKGVHRFFDMPDFISFVSYHPSGCILRKIYKYQGISSVWLKNAQTLNRHAWRLLQRRVAEPLEQKVFLPKRRQKPWSTPRPLRNKAVQPRAVRIGRIFYDFMIPPLRPLDLSP